MRMLSIVLLPILAVLLVACGGSSLARDSDTRAGPPWASASGTDDYGTWADLTVTGNGETAVQRFRLIMPGTFQMGSPSDEPMRLGNEDQHAVTISEPYWIADTAYTQRLWVAVMGSNPSHFTAAGLDLPVETVTHDDVQVFLTGLATLKPDLAPMLPTEAQWEYAARAGTTTPFSVTSVSTDTINSSIIADDPYVSTGTDRERTVVVKSLPANPWGLYEVHGNVWEWCSDWYEAVLGGDPVTDPAGPASGSVRVLRGGCWGSSGDYCRSALRFSGHPGYALNDMGFRLAAPAQPAGGG